MVPEVRLCAPVQLASAKQLSDQVPAPVAIQNVSLLSCLEYFISLLYTFSENLCIILSDDSNKIKYKNQHTDAHSFLFIQ